MSGEIEEVTTPVSEVDILLGQQVEIFKNELAKSPGAVGEYFIPDIRIEEWKDPRVSMLSKLLTYLAINFHQYTWQQTESLNPTVRGVLIKWYPKR